MFCRKNSRIKIKLVFKETDYILTNGKICTKIKISLLSRKKIHGVLKLQMIRKSKIPASWKNGSGRFHIAIHVLRTSALAATEKKFRLTRQIQERGKKKCNLSSYKMFPHFLF